MLRARIAFGVVVVALLASATNARAADAFTRARRGEDSTYGRLEGDVAFAIGAGATFGARAPRGTVDARIRYLEVVGLFGTYEDALGGRAEPERVVATGLEVRPLFFGRWLKGMRSGSPFLDLTLDSLALEIGAAFQEPRGASLGARPALQTGAGLEFPIFGRAQGLWLGAHGGARFGERALDASLVRTPIDRSLYLGLTLSFHLYVDAHVVDAGDRRVGDD